MNDVVVDVVIVVFFVIGFLLYDVDVPFVVLLSFPPMMTVMMSSHPS